MMITSNQNPKIKLVRALLSRTKERREAGAFVIEGVRLFEEAVRSAWEIKFVLYDERLSKRGKLQVESLKLKNVEVEEISTSVMQSLSETETPQGVLAVLADSQIPMAEALNFVLIPDQIRDPGNLGTLLRSAAATGAQAALIPPETTDVFAPKVLRAGMGAHFRLPIRLMDWEAIRAFVEARRLQVLIADMDGVACWDCDLTQPLALVIGGEAAGASTAALQLAEGKVGLPMRGEVESLNAGVAGSALMFEVLRQRR
ncbi:MAG: RNA methyltransferase [Anaerolineales bacterium]|nr:RNA methyltransferase [Anaerolineales bacterium]